MDHHSLTETLRDQDGVVSRAQRVRLEHAVLDLASEAPDDMAAFRLLTVRLTNGQVFGAPCRTASRVGAVLQRRGKSPADLVPNLCGQNT